MNEHIKWVCVYKTPQKFEAEVIKGNLESAGIPCILLNKQDSSYLAFGYVELHVPDNYQAQAEALIPST
jgi:hypothetical protein